MCIHLQRASKYIKQKLTESKKKIDKFTVIDGYLNPLLSQLIEQLDAPSLGT